MDVSYGRNDALACSASRCVGKERISLLFQVSISLLVTSFYRNAFLSLIIARSPVSYSCFDPAQSRPVALSFATVVYRIV